MDLFTAVELVCVGLALWAGALSLKPPPKLVWERLFKLSLATLLRGEVEANQGDQAQWWERLLEQVPFHPAGRNPEDKLSNPDPDCIPIPAVDGERALVNTLASLGGAQERYRVMFGDEDACGNTLMIDPSEMGAAYDPGRVIAPGADWDSVAAWNDEIQAGLARRLADVHLITIGLDSTGLSDAVPHGRVSTMAADELAQLDVPNTDRLVLVCGSAHVLPVLKTLHESPSLRDRMRMLVSLGGQMDAGQEWLAEHFQHGQMDTELNRRTAYMGIVDVDPDDPLSRDWNHQRFPTPPVPPSGYEPIEAIDLGPLPLQRIAPKILGRALWVLTAFCLADR